MIKTRVISKYNLFFNNRYKGCKKPHFINCTEGKYLFT